MDNKRKITCALDSIKEASESRKFYELGDDKGLQWAAEMLKNMLDDCHKKGRYGGNQRTQS